MCLYVFRNSENNGVGSPEPGITGCCEMPSVLGTGLKSSGIVENIFNCELLVQSLFILFLCDECFACLYVYPICVMCVPWTEEGIRTLEPGLRTVSQGSLALNHRAISSAP